MTVSRHQRLQNIIGLRSLVAVAALLFSAASWSQADLVVSSGEPSVSPNPVAAGDSFQLSPWTVANTGLLPSGSFSNGFYLSTNDVISSADTFLGGNSNASLSVGGSFDWGGPMLIIPLGTAPGNYWIGILVDRAAQVPEIDELNNYVSTPVTVTDGVSQPDLVISSGPPGVDSTTLEAGNAVTVDQWTVHNQGTLDAGAFSVGLYLSSDSIIGTSDIYLGRSSVNSGLSSGASRVINSRTVTIPIGTPTGNYWIGPLVDRLSEISESDENNNFASAPIVVTNATGFVTLFDGTDSCDSGAGLSLSQFGPSSTSSFDVASAARFTVTSGEVWRPERLTAYGIQNFIDSDPSVRVRFYSSKSISCGIRCSTSVPDLEVCSFDLNTGDFGDLVLDLPAVHNCELTSGLWFVSVQQERADCSLSPCETWNWDQATDPGRVSPQWAIRDFGNTVLANTCDAEWGRPQECLASPPGIRSGLCVSVEGTVPVVANRPPEADDSLRLRTVEINQPFQLDLAEFFADPDDDSLSYSQIGLPAGLSIDPPTGVIDGQASVSLGNTFNNVEVTATDPDGLSDVLRFHLRILANELPLPPPDTPDLLLRCSTTVAQGVGTLLVPISFETTDQCPDPGAASCRIPDPGETLVLATVSLDISHPSVGDLAIRLDHSTGSLSLFDDGSDCDRADIRAVLSDSAPWRAQRRCNSLGPALMGPLSPSERLAGLRNLSPIDHGPFTLNVANSAGEAARINQWCLAAQVNRAGQLIYPQIDLPGDAEAVSLVSDTQAVRSGNLAYPSQADWYRVIQPFSCVQQVNATLRPSGDLVPRFFLDSDRINLDPFATSGTCVESTGLPEFSLTSKGVVSYFRIQACPDSPGGPYQVDFERVGFLCGTSGGFGLGKVQGSVVDDASGLPLGFVYLELTSGESTLSDPIDGSFELSATPISFTAVTAFSDGHLPLTIDSITVTENETTTVGQLRLIGADYGALVNDLLFASGFE